jgi:hypothetical protein
MGNCCRALLLAVCAFFAGSPVFATILNIQAINYPVGTNLTNAFSGVTLYYASHTAAQSTNFNTAPLVVGTDTATFGGPPLLIPTLGSYTDGNDTGTDLLTTGAQWDAVEAVFSAPVYGVKMDSYSDEYDGTQDFIFAYSASGAFLGEGNTISSSCVPSVRPPGSCYGDDYVSTFTSSTPIGFVLMTTDDVQGYVTGIQVPEPSSIALLGFGLLGIGVVTSYRRRRDYLGNHKVH